MSQINGRISQIIGPVIDVYFDTKGENPEKVLPKIHVQTAAISSSRCNSTSVKIPCVVSPWTIPMACSADWRLSLRATQLSCQQVSKSRVV